jgi:hypothetical protein
VVFKESRLVVEGVDMAQRTAAKDHDDAFGFRGKVRLSRCEGTRWVDERTNRTGCGQELISCEQIKERDAAEAMNGLRKEAAAVEESVHIIRGRGTRSS